MIAHAIIMSSPLPTQASVLVYPRQFRAVARLRTGPCSLRGEQARPQAQSNRKSFPDTDGDVRNGEFFNQQFRLRVLKDSSKRRESHPLRSPNRPLLPTRGRQPCERGDPISLSHDDRHRRRYVTAKSSILDGPSHIAEPSSNHQRPTPTNYVKNSGHYLNKTVDLEY